MAVSQIIEITVEFNNAGLKNIDVSGWDWVTIQLVAPASAVSFLGSNDAGAITGGLDGNALTAINFTPLFLINLATGVGATTGAVTGLWRGGVGSKFIQLSGTTAAKILVHLSKIY